jgi:hypothetical protein
VLQQITELSLDTIQRQLKYLIDRGFVSAQKRRRKGHWASWNYKINLSALTGPTACCSRDQAASCGSDDDCQAATCGTDQAADCGTATPQIAAQPSRRLRLYPSKYPSKEAEREEPQPTSIPDLFRLDDRTYAWALERLGNDPARVVRSVRRFVDNARDKGSVSCDWMAKARMWIDSDGDQSRTRPHAAVDANRDDARPVTSDAAPSEKEWNDVLATYVKARYWTRHVNVFGPDPSSPGCRAPIHLLVKHGLALGGLPQAAE